MNIVFYIASRYAFTKSRQSIINIISLISSLVLVVGTAALFVVLSAFGGLRQISLNSVNASNPDLRIEAKRGKFFEVNQLQQKKLSSLDGVVSWSKILEERVFLNFKNKSFIAYVRGVDKDYSSVVHLPEYVFLGDWSIKNYRSVVGVGISKALGLGIFDSNNFLEIIVPKSGMKLVTSLDGETSYNHLYLTVSGVYSINDEIDKKYVYLAIDKVRHLLEVNANEVSSLEIKLYPNTKEYVIRNRLKKIFGENIHIRNRFQQNISVYKMLKTESAIIYLIFTLILIVALFNLSGAIIMMILEKKKDLWTLLSFGFTISQLRRVFLFQGMIVTTVSAIIGLTLGYMLCLLQLKFGLLEIGFQQPYPVMVSSVDAIMVFLIILSLGFLVSWFTSRKVSEGMFLE